MTPVDAKSDTKTRRRIRLTAWIVGSVAVAIYVVSIIDVVLRR